MATWLETKEWVRAHHVVSEDETEWIGIRWEPQDTGERVIRAKLELTRAWDEPWLLIMVEICPAGALEAAEALRQNGRLALGALATEGQLLVVRHTMRLAILLRSELELALAALYEAARNLRRTMPSSDRAFDHLIE